MRLTCIGWMVCALGLAACANTPPAPTAGTDKPSAPAAGVAEDPAQTPTNPAEDPSKPVGNEDPITVDNPNQPGIDDTTPVVPQSGLMVQHAMQYPTRLAVAPNGQIIVTDARVGSAFIYTDKLLLAGEIKGIEGALGVAVSADGTIYVGSAKTQSVEVFSAKGVKLATIGAGEVKMPNSLAFDAAGNLYVADSRSNVVKVFATDGKQLSTIGAGQLLFPAAVTVVGDELFVADQGNFRVVVFDLEGSMLREFGEAVEEFSADWQGRFVKVQGLAVDAEGRIHVADSYLNTVQVFSASTGAFVSSYAEPGSGLLTLPLDIAITAKGQVIVANTESQRVEAIYNVAIPAAGEEE